MASGGFERPAVRLTLVARVDGGTPEQLPQLVNLSRQSLVVRSAELLEPGRPVHLTLELATMEQTVEIEAVVVWRNQEQGDMALRFVKLSKGGDATLLRYLTVHS